ncbi:MAG: hypothetical protein A2W99_04290 [Bacteroidetes bacterium GWF2_33_16]|nr:MAG: hypothetical protein A2X00_16810 [Bacteroidetes bacterium GWE2_32_14]OFY05891.1 MAG: hypothetical protein A2W99_04290 [Bacteroidetes bacterium GWF2_33_16]
MLKDILSISGYGGLFKYISQGRNGIIVESLEDQRRMPAHASAKVSALEDISVFTETDDMPLKDVLKAISDKENGGPAIDHKASNSDLKKYFEQVLPNFDKERVYTSDIKKIINWYNILQKLNLLNFEEKEEDKSEAKDEVKEEMKLEKVVKEKKEPKAKNVTKKSEPAKTGNKQTRRKV